MDNLALYNHFLGSFGMPARLSALALRDLLQLQLQNQSLNPLNRFGNKVYSQNDEDGITFEIVRRLGISKGTFLELGVGNGTENNTLSLIAAGWKGVWLGGEDLAFSPEVEGVGVSQRLGFKKEWITPANCTVLAGEELNRRSINQLDLISIDLDGNDLFIAKAFLEGGFKPKIFILEYNAKFPPPIAFSIDPDSSHSWAGDDYMGASLQSIDNLMSKFGYSLVCCNLSGCNAFYVESCFMDKFQDVPAGLEKIYQPARYFLSFMRESGHAVSVKTIISLLKC
jgi:hypothetical protein